MVVAGWLKLELKHKNDMGQIDDEIKTAIRELTGSDDVIFQGVVTEVNEEEFTCTVRRDDAVDYFDVRLRGLVNADLQGLAFIPRMESVVLVSRIGKSNEAFVCQFTEIEKVIFTADDLEFLLVPDKIEVKKGDNISILFDKDVISILNDKSKAEIKADAINLSNDKSTAEIKADEILFNGGELGGLVKIKELDKNLESLKKFVEAMHAALPGAFSAILAALSANGALGAQAYNASMAGQMIKLENMENEKVKH